MWSPDSKKIAYSDKRLNLWFVDVASGASKLVDTDFYEGPQFSQNWAPDSKWIAYAKQLPSHLHTIFVYSLENGDPQQAEQILKGLFERTTTSANSRYNQNQNSALTTRSTGNQGTATTGTGFGNNSGSGNSGFGTGGGGGRGAGQFP